MPDVATGMRYIAVLAVVYGLCMYRSSRNGVYFVFVNSSAGVLKQWQLYDTGRQTVDARLVRQFDVGSQTEGCMADDATGRIRRL